MEKISCLLDLLEGELTIADLEGADMHELGRLGRILYHWSVLAERQCRIKEDKYINETGKDPYSTEAEAPEGAI